MHSTNTWIAIALALALAGCSKSSGRSAPPPSSAWLVVGAGSTAELRHGHTATALPDGTVLLTGGSSSDAGALASAELYDPQAGYSEPLVARLATPRVGHQAVLLPDGRVWVLGGFDAQGEPLASTELYDPSTRTFSPGPELRCPRADASLVVYGDRVAVIGGRGTTDVEVWTQTPLAQRWDFALPAAIEGGTVVEVDGDRRAAVVVGARLADGAEAAPVWLDLDGHRAAAQEGGEWLRGGVALRHTGSEGVVSWVLGGRLVSSGAYTREAQRLVVPPRLEGGEVGAFPEAFDARTFDARVQVRQQRDRISAVSTSAGAWLIGGETQGTPLATIERVRVGETLLGQPLQIARSGARAVALDDGRVVVTGGLDAQGRRVGLIEQVVPADGVGPDGELAFAARQAELDELARLRQALAETLDLLAAERALTDDLRGQLDAALASLAQRDAQIASLQGRLAALEAQLSQAQQQNAALRQQIASLQGQLAQAQAQVTQQQTEIARLRQELADARSEIDRLRQVERDLREELAAQPPAAPAPAPPSPTPSPTGIRSAGPLFPGPIGGIVKGRPRVS